MIKNTAGHITKVSGPLIVAENMKTVKMFDVVFVGPKRLIGEIIELRGANASIQVYEETEGLRIGDEVINSGEPLSVELGPGILGEIFDGIGRPLDTIRKEYGDFISRGISVPSISRTKKWDFVVSVKVGDTVSAGDIIGTVQENEVISHKILVPFGISGEVVTVTSGSFTVTDTVAVIKSVGKTGEELINIQMLQKWPIRKNRPYKRKLIPNEPLITGQRVIDTLFPVAKGGVAAIPGPFGSGKTVVQHQIAKWSDAEIVIYIGCGERGNEICDVLQEFPRLIDSRNGFPMMKRTVLIANTSDMPVAAREASIYTGITIAEYFRDMGYNVAVMADSTSRWAEALREMSGRLEEIPGEEGYPAYLASRIAEFYERAGVVEILGSDPPGPYDTEQDEIKNSVSGPRIGSITAIGAVSPPSGDLSEPVSQATLRIVKAFWGLSYTLAHRRHFPAIDWLASYSLYAEKMADWYTDNISSRFLSYRAKALKILQQDFQLQEISRLVGLDSLSDADRATMDTAKRIKEDFLHQNAFDEEDTYTPYKTQFERIKEIIDDKKNN
jgi:V/A-type H+-transporting ATPase subunit A